MPPAFCPSRWERGSAYSLRRRSRASLAAADALLRERPPQTTRAPRDETLLADRFHAVDSSAASQSSRSLHLSRIFNSGISQPRKVKVAPGTDCVWRRLKTEKQNPA